MKFTLYGCRVKQKLFGIIFQLWVAYAPCGSQHKDAVQVTLEQIDLIKRLIGQYPGHLAFVNDSTSKDAFTFIIFCSKVLTLKYNLYK